LRFENGSLTMYVFSVFRVILFIYCSYSARLVTDEQLIVSILRSYIARQQPCQNYDVLFVVIFFCVFRFIIFVYCVIRVAFITSFGF
jgi:hypothetical protein